MRTGSPLWRSPPYLGSRGQPEHLRVLRQSRRRSHRRLPPGHQNSPEKTPRRRLPSGGRLPNVEETTGGPFLFDSFAGTGHLPEANVTERLVPASQQRHTERTKFAASKPPGNHRILLHHPASARLVGSLENHDSCVDRPHRRSRQHQHSIVQQRLESCEVLCPHRLLLAGHRLAEVLARWMYEVDPLSHAPSVRIPSLPHTDSAGARVH